VWYLEQGKSPKGTIDLRLNALDPETFFFHELFVHRVTK
jgi:hypothetical protein